MLGITPLQIKVPWAQNNAWKHWINHIMEQKKNYGFKQAGLYGKRDGVPDATTEKFNVKTIEVLALREFFDEPKPQQTILLGGKTYIVKKADGNQIIAFNGSKYFIITQSNSKFILVYCVSRAKHEEGALWLKNLTEKLKARNY